MRTRPVKPRSELCGTAYFQSSDQLDDLDPYAVGQPPVTGPAAALPIPEQPAGGTPVSGTLSADTTWTAANSPYVVADDNLIVPAGITLTIEPGTQVMLDQYHNLVVSGTLSAVGTVTQPITFTAYYSGEYRYWQRYPVYDSENDKYWSVDAVGAALNGDVWFVKTFSSEGLEAVAVCLRANSTLSDTFDISISLGTSEITALAVDGVGQKWFATDAGVVMLAADEVTWTSYDTGDGLASNEVNDVAVDRDDSVWFATNNGVSRRTTAGAWTSYDTNDGLASNAVYAIATDDDGNLWFGTSAGLSKRTPGGTWTTYDSLNSGILSDDISDVAVAANGDVWTAHWGGVSARLAAGGWTTYTTANSGLASTWVEAINIDATGVKWVGYGSAGVSLLSADGATWTHVAPPTPGSESGENASSPLGAGTVKDVAVATNGAVWLANAQGGAIRSYYSAYHDGVISGGHWGSLRIAAESGGGEGEGEGGGDSPPSRLSHVTLELGGVDGHSTLQLQDLADNPPTLDHLTVRGGGGDGLYAYNVDGLELYSATLTSNEGNGLHIAGGTGGHELLTVTLQHNNGHGLYLDHPGNISVISATLAHNAGYGVFTADGGNTLTLQDSAVHDNAVAGRLAVNALWPNTLWRDNLRQEIEWLGGTIDGNRTWPGGPFDACVVLGDVTVGNSAALTVTTGAEVRFGPARLTAYGRLLAVGTADAPVTFGPADEETTWYGVQIGGGEGNSDASHLSYAVIRGATAGLSLQSSAPTLDHLGLIENETGLSVNYSGSMVITASNFVNNQIYGIHNHQPSQQVISATGSFWGTPNGPYHETLNPDGDGDEVSDGVSFDPWLAKPPYIAGVNYVLVNRNETDRSTLAYDADTGLYTRYYPDEREVHFDAQGRHDYTLEPDGRKTTYTYNPDGTLNTMGIVVPGESNPRWEWTFEYHNGKLLRITDPAGRISEVTIDDNGHLAQVTLPDGSQRQFYYDARGLLTQQVDPAGHVSDYVYDDYGRLVEHISPQREIYTSTIPAGETTVGRETKTFTPSDSAYPLINDSLVGDPDNPAPAVPTSTLMLDEVSYGRGGYSGHTNQWGHWLDKTDALGRTTTYERDEASQLTKSTQPNGECVETDYDQAGNPVRVRRMGATQCALPPEQRDDDQIQVTTMTYESRFNQLKTSVDPLGHITTYYYDYELGLGEAGKLVRVEYPSVQDENGVLVTPVISTTYNSWGLRETVTDERGTVTRYVYTEAGLLTKVIQDDSGLTLTTVYTDFDAMGNALTVIGPDGSNVTSYVYDLMGRIISETNPLGIVTLYEYNGNGNLARQTMDYGGDNIITEYTYSAGGHLASEQAMADELAVYASYAYDSNGNQAYQKDVLGHQTTFGYDAAGQVTYAINTAGDIVTYTHNMNGRIETVTNVDGTVIRQIHDDLGRISRSVTNWDDGAFDPNEPDKDIETRYEYDATGNTIIVTDTLGQMTRTWYDGRDHVLGRITNWDSHTTLDDCATLSAVRDENICTLYAYDLAGHTVIITDTLGRMTRTWYDALGRVEATVVNWNPATLSSPADCILSPTNESVENVCTLYGYDAAGNQITTTNALNQTDLTVYDAANRPVINVANWDGTTLEDESDCSFPPARPDTNLCTVTYFDARDQIIAARDPLGHQTEFGYNGLGQLITTTRYLGGEPVITVNHYDTLGNLVGQSDALGHTVTYVYDELGRLVKTISPEGVQIAQSYNTVGQVITMTDGLGHAVIIDRDAFGRRSTVTDAEGNVTQYAYDGLGNQIAMIDANGVRTGYEYDGLNRLVSVVENDADGTSTHDSNVLTQYAYDALGNRLIITNALGYTSTHTIYDALGRPSIVEDALGHQTHTRYNALGYRTVVTDAIPPGGTQADGAVMRYNYDSLNRLIAVHYETDGVTVQYEYDAVGNRMAMTDTLGVTRYEYDDLYRLVSVTNPFTGTVVYGYDLAGNRTQLIYPDLSEGSGQSGKVVTYTYGADNRLVQVQDWDGGLTSYAYDTAGRLITTTLPNDVVTTNQYDDANRLTRIEHKDAEENLLARYVYVLDQVGHRIGTTETISIPAQGLVTTAITYTYDGLQRLVVADYSTSEKFEYVYDAVGNRTIYTATVGGNPDVTTYSYDAANRLANVGGVAYTWDDGGRLLDDGTYQYTWDTAGQLITVTDGVNTLGFRYDGDGNRLIRIVNGTLTTHTLDVGLVLPELLVAHGDGSTTHYLHLSSGVATDDTGTWTYSALDALDSVRQRLDASGQVLSANAYRPFGLPLAGDGGDLYGYTGEWWEGDAGLLHLRARYLQVETGRFISQDPWPGHFRLPQTLNRYAYVENNPVNWLDPSGCTSERSGCGDPRCLVFYFPGTGKVDNDYQNSPEYNNNERSFIDRLALPKGFTLEGHWPSWMAGFGGDDKFVIFPFMVGDSYLVPGMGLSPEWLAFLREKTENVYIHLLGILTMEYEVSRAQWIQLEQIQNDGFSWLFPIKADEIADKINQELIGWGETPESLEIDFVAHSGGSHIALNTASFMPATGFRVDDVVALGGLFKAYEWKEMGSLASINAFYDILGDADTTVQPARNGMLSLTEEGERFNYTEWHKGIGNLPNAERIHAGKGHSSYWDDEGVNKHLQSILCENKE